MTLTSILTKLHTPYNKFVVALVGAVLQVVAEYFGNNPWVHLVLLVLTAAGVYQVPNKVED